MRHVRIVAKATSDNPEAPPLYVDAVIDEEGRVAGRHSLFGIQGDFDRKDEHFYPFVLDSVGGVDFGKGFDQPAGERYGQLDIRDKLIESECLLTLDMPNYGRCFYRSSDLIELPTQ